MAISNKNIKNFDYCNRYFFYRHFLPKEHEAHRFTMRSTFPHIKKYLAQSEFVFNIDIIQSELLQALYA